MNITRISFSYFFLGVGLLSIVFYVYFKMLSIKSDPKSKDRKKVIGEMKDVALWTEKNKMMEYLSLGWAVISIALFAFFKFFYTTTGLISIIFPFVYIAMIAASVMLFMPKKKVL
ncbi:hypothetical protein KQI86_11050 [Clostridium sp. MSJ-11]|uniref:DUF3784 domain-containing protein n=1 Tax=Clostridium mobile TaxID=2841512 RepID=A0ABS6EIK6_9CLOT|nr:hypothetical protein [Clostridium mobile]MBU5484873.1 hypothetical protein [Clostridium mobile]